ncbi:trigger factor [candidate division KSB3 bacterium]|uniref:Trigger factor n=1 Tax=candidate division KSB3 bacterium TaxID=2044937 RepID=A0A2G6KEK8_9BACT|nr:MAG: trigger factor [candidate division KSB3 bacterium]
MNVAVEELGACQKKLTIHVPVDEVNKQYQDVVRDIRKNVALPGFRKGKASISTIKRRFQKQIHDEVKEKLLETSFRDALIEKDIAPVGTPDIDVKSIKVVENAPVEYVAEVEFWQPFDVENYKEVEISKKNAPETSEEQIAETLEALQRQNAYHEPVEDGHVIVDNDSVTVNYQRSLDGVLYGEAVENVSFWLGVDQHFPELADHVFGKQKGDHVDFSVTYEEDAPNKNLAGKTLDFAVDIVNVEKVVLPELDDEFAKDLEEESLETLRQKIADNLKAQAERNLVVDAKNRLLMKIAEDYSFDIPPSLISSQKKATPDKEDEEIIKMLRAGAVLAKIQQKEGISVSDTEVDEAIATLSMQQRLPAATMKSFLASQPDGIERLRGDIRESKTLDFLYENAKVVEEE